MPKKLTIPAKSYDVEIASVSHVKGQSVTVNLREVAFDSLGNPVTGFAIPMSNDLTRIIEGTQYADLMSDRPSWAPQKPASTFREDDLWRFIGAV